jgi:hypothetical protein
MIFWSWAFDILIMAGGSLMIGTATQNAVIGVGVFVVAFGAHSFRFE